MVPKAFAVGVAIFASLPCCLAQDVITEDTYFYGESPPVYPSPQITGLGDWADAYSKAKAQVAQLTLDEKINLTVGYAPTSGCSGAIAPIPHIGFKGLCLSDAGNGVRNTDFVSSWPSGIHVGASWNKNLAHRRGMAMGKEAKKKGVNVLLGPVVGPVGRVVLGGRNWEGFSPDPYLAGQLVAESVSGVQGAGVQTSTKHYIGNEQELDRNPNSDHSIESVSSNIDDVTMHELYLWPFQDAVRAGTANIMCSYQRVNNSYGCQNSKLLNGALKEELGFQGYVVTDWTALRSGVGAALAGLDMAMPNGGAFWGANLTKAVLNGTVEETRIDDMATRILAAWYYLKQDQDFPPSGYGMPKDLTAPHEKVEARDVADKPILSAGAVEGHVLLKNIDNTLPLKNPKTLSIFGYSAEAPPANAPNATGFSPWVLGFESALNSLQAVLGAFLGLPSTKPPPAIASNGTLLAGGGSGAVSQSTFMSPFAALMNRADADNTQVWWDLVSGTPSVMQDSDACLVFGNAWASESFDRPGLRDDFTDGLILHVASQCRRTVVVLHNAGVRLVDQWIEHPNVTAVIFAHLPGQETGKALVSLLYGESHFSGKLPYTVAKNESDYGDLLKPTVGEGRFKKFPQSNFTEGVYIDYKHFDREGIEPRFEFGFGLGYTTFAFSNLRVEPVAGRNGTAPYPTGEIIQGGSVDLWDVVARVSVDVTNTGAVDGAEVAQLYVAIPGGPEKQLRGFEKLPLKPGQAATAKFELTRRDLSAWDVVAQKWKLQSAEYGIFVGSSSRQLPLQGKLQLGCKKRRV